MNKSTPNKYRVAITPTSEQDLLALRYAFEGNMAHGEHKECSDDVLVAALLGWHLRKIGRQHDTFFKSVVQEFYTRSREDAPEWMEPQDVAIRKQHRGSAGTQGNILTLDGIDDRTLIRIKSRAHAVGRMLAKLTDLVDKPTAQERWESVDAVLLRWSDQAIMDLCIWFVLTKSEQTGEDVESYPHWIKDEIEARGQARTEYEAGELEPGPDPEKILAETGCVLTLKPRALSPEQNHVENEKPPSLTPRDRRVFFILRRIHPGENFWTDERIRAAMRMGF